MSRRRYQIIDGEIVEVTNVPAPQLAPDSGALWGDANYRDMQASDGTPIDTRTKHRDYMRQRGITTIDDYTEEFKRRGEARAKQYQGAPDPQRAHDIARAWEKLRDRRG